METGRVVLLAPHQAPPVGSCRAVMLAIVVCLAAYVGCTFALALHQEGEKP